MAHSEETVKAVVKGALLRHSEMINYGAYPKATPDQVTCYTAKNVVRYLHSKDENGSSYVPSQKGAPTGQFRLPCTKGKERFERAKGMLKAISHVAGILKIDPHSETARDLLYETSVKILMDRRLEAAKELQALVSSGQITMTMQTRKFGWIRDYIFKGMTEEQSGLLFSITRPLPTDNNEIRRYNDDSGYVAKRVNGPAKELLEKIRLNKPVDGKSTFEITP